MTPKDGISWNGEDIYDNSFTIYDLRFGKFAHLRRGGMQSKYGRVFMEPCTDVVRKRRWHLAAPMYDVRRTMYDLQSLRALRGTAKQERAECDKAVRGRSYKGAGALGGARGQTGSAYVRGTTRTTAVSAYGQRGCAAPEG